MKKALIIALSFMLMLTLSSCGGSSTAPAPSAPPPAASGTATVPETSPYTPQNPFVLRIGFENSPTDTSVSHGFKWADMLAERSGGRIKLEVFASSELGNGTEMFQMVQEGSLDMTSLIPFVLANFDPRLELSCIPGLYRDAKQAQYFDQSGFINELTDQYFAENGVYRIVRGEVNFYNILTTEAAGQVTSLDDLKGLKIRISNSPGLKYFFEGAGALPTPIAWGEIYTSLQRNVISATITNNVWGTSAKFPEVARVINLVPLCYSPSDWMINKNTWDNMPADIKQIIQDSIPDLRKSMQESWDALSVSNEEAQVKQGITYVRLTTEEIEAWQKGCFAIMREYCVSVWGEDIVKRLENEIIHA